MTRILIALLLFWAHAVWAQSPTPLPGCCTCTCGQFSQCDNGLADAAACQTFCGCVTHFHAGLTCDSGCGGDWPTPTATNTPVPTVTPQITPGQTCIVSHIASTADIVQTNTSVSGCVPAPPAWPTEPAAQCFYDAVVCDATVAISPIICGPGKISEKAGYLRFFYSLPAGVTVQSANLLFGSSFARNDAHDALTMRANYIDPTVFCAPANWIPPSGVSAGSIIIQNVVADGATLNAIPLTNLASIGQSATAFEMTIDPSASAIAEVDINNLCANPQAQLEICYSAEATPTPQPPATATWIAQQTETAGPQATETQAQQETQTAAPSGTPTATGTVTQTPTGTAPTATVTQTQTRTVTPTATPTRTPTGSMLSCCVCPQGMCLGVITTTQCLLSGCTPGNPGTVCTLVP